MDGDVYHEGFPSGKRRCVGGLGTWSLGYQTPRTPWLRCPMSEHCSLCCLCVMIDCLIDKASAMSVLLILRLNINIKSSNVGIYPTFHFIISFHLIGRAVNRKDVHL